MIKIYKSNNTKTVFIETVTSGFAEDFEYIQSGSLFTIQRTNTNIVEVNEGHFSDFVGLDNAQQEITFSSAGTLATYLDGVFSVDTIVTEEEIINNDQLGAVYYTKTEIDTQQGTQDSAIALNTSKVSADQSITTHSDVDTSGASNNDILIYDGSSWVVGQIPSDINTNLQLLAGNILRYTNEQGTNQDINLTYLLDNTNLPRIVSGSLNTSNYVLTLTRDDATSITINLTHTHTEADITDLDKYTQAEVNAIQSGLQSDISTAITNHEAAADPHSQYNTTFSEAVSNDPNTNITAAEAEQLSNGSNADILHVHSQIQSANGNTNVVVDNTSYRVTLGSDEVVNILASDGTKSLNLPLGGQQIKNLSNPTTDLDAANKQYVDQTRQAIKLTNTGATGNLNTGVAVLSAFNTTDQLGINSASFSPAANGITCNFDGVVEVIFNCQLSGTVTRGVPGFRWLNGASNGPWVQHTYIRNASGHTESSCNFTTLVPVVNGSTIQIQHDNFAGGGTIISPINGIEFILKRIR